MIYISSIYDRSGTKTVSLSFNSILRILVNKAWAWSAELGSQWPSAKGPARCWAWPLWAKQLHQRSPCFWLCMASSIGKLRVEDCQDLSLLVRDTSTPAQIRCSTLNCTPLLSPLPSAYAPFCTTRTSLNYTEFQYDPSGKSRGFILTKANM